MSLSECEDRYELTRKNEITALGVFLTVTVSVVVVMLALSFAYNVYLACRWKKPDRRIAFVDRALGSLKDDYSKETKLKMFEAVRTTPGELNLLRDPVLCR